MAEPAIQRYKGIQNAKNPNGPPFQRLMVRNPATSSKCELEQYTSAHDAQNGARLYDCIQILLRGAAADTNFSISSYTQSAVLAAAVKLKEAGWDVQQAVKAAQRNRGASTYLWVIRNRNCNSAKLFESKTPCSEVKTLGASAGYFCGTFTTDVEAAREADIVSLVLNVEHAKLNFPASSYSVQQLDGTHQAVAGWVAERPAHQAAKKSFLDMIRGNMDAVKQASPTAWLQLVDMLQLLCCIQGPGMSLSCHCIQPPRDDSVIFRYFTFLGMWHLNLRYLSVEQSLGLWQQHVCNAFLGPPVGHVVQDLHYALVAKW
jgi:hypothetical protein